MKLQISEDTYQKITEVAKRSESLSDDTCLFTKSLNSGYELVLFSPTDKKVHGMIGIRKHQTSDYFVSYVAATGGFGVYMYELAMMFLDDDDAGLMPDRSGNIRERAWNVWKIFYERTDVEKYPASGNNYSTNFNIFLGDDVNPKDVEIYNTIYYMQPDPSFGKYIQNAENYNKNVDRIFNLADKLLHKLY